MRWSFVVPFLATCLLTRVARADSEQAPVVQNAPLEVAVSAPPDAVDLPKSTYVPDIWVSPGFLFTTMAGKTGCVGLGGEITVNLVPSPYTYAGLFGQVQQYRGDVTNYVRSAVGVQAGSAIGAELGYDNRASHESYATTHGVHAGVFFSLAVISLGVRASVPVATTGPGDSQGFEIGFAGTIKIPLGDYDGT